MAAAHLDAHVAGGNIELVVDHEQLFGLDLVLAAELGDGAARGVHIRLRLDQHDLALAALFLGVVDVDERDLGSGLVFPVRDAGLAGQLVDRLKAGVMAGLGILLARVAKSGNMRILSGCAAAMFVLRYVNSSINDKGYHARRRRGFASAKSHQTKARPRQSERRNRRNPRATFAKQGGARGFLLFRRRCAGLQGRCDYSAKSPPTSVETGSSW